MDGYPTDTESVSYYCGKSGSDSKSDRLTRPDRYAGTDGYTCTDRYTCTHGDTGSNGNTGTDRDAEPHADASTTELYKEPKARNPGGLPLPAAILRTGQRAVQVNIGRSSEEK
jgi:hypothetical protein